LLDRQGQGFRFSRIIGCERWDELSTDHALLGFIRKHFKSVWALEQLLLMRRTAPQRWSVDELVKELRASAPLVLRNLDAFERAGLILADENGAHAFAPATPLLSALCDELATAYSERPVAVMNTITSSDDKLQDLADAFKLRKDPK
jgi:hypothetical protein